MNPKGKKLPKPPPAREGQDLAEAADALESCSAIHRLSDVEREAIQQGSDAAKFGSFAPEEEMEEFYRLHRGA